MIPPENAWLRRSNDDIIIGCYSSQQTWQLKCDGREWKGLVGTCPELCKKYFCAFCPSNKTNQLIELIITHQTIASEWPRSFSYLIKQGETPTNQGINAQCVLLGKPQALRTPERHTLSLHTESIKHIHIETETVSNVQLHLSNTIQISERKQYIINLSHPTHRTL